MAKEEENDGYLNSFDFGEIQNVAQEDVASLTQAEEESLKEEKPNSAEKNDSEELDVNSLFKEKEDASEENKEENKEVIKSSDEHPDNIEKNKDVDESSSGTPFAVVFAETLMEQGALSDFNLEDYKKEIEEKGEDGAIISLFEQQDEKHKNEIVSHYEKDYKEYLELKEIGVPKAEALDLTSMKAHYEKITPEALALEDATDLRKNLISEYYASTTQLTDEEISDIVTKIVDAGEDEKYAKAYLPKMQTHINTIINNERQAKIIARETALANVEKTKLSLKTTIDSIEEIIPGTKINKNTKDKLYQALTTTQSVKDGKNMNIITAKREENKTKFDVTLAYLINSGAFDGKWDKLEEKISTKANKKLLEAIGKNNKVSDLNTQKAKNDTEDSIMESNLNSMKGLL